MGSSCNVMMCKRVFAHQTQSNGEIPFYKIGTIGSNPDAYISKELFEEYKKKYNYPRKNEVMITCAGTVGRCWQFDGTPSYYQDSNIVWINNPQEVITNNFIYRLLERTDWSKLNSTTITRIYNDNLRELNCYYPNKSEQNKITDFLSLIDKRIDKQRQLLENLKKYKRGLFLSLYNDSKKKSYKIGELGKYCSTGILSKEDINLSGKYPCILYGELFTKYNEVINHVISRTDVVPTYLSGSNEVLFPSSTTVDAESLIFPSSLKIENIFLGGDLFTIKLKDEFDSDFMSYLINYVYKHVLARYAQGITIIHLHYDDIKEQIIDIPNIDTQHKIQHLMKEITTLTDINNSVLNYMLLIKQGLLQQMFI